MSDETIVVKWASKKNHKPREGRCTPRKIFLIPVDFLPASSYTKGAGMACGLDLLPCTDLMDEDGQAWLVEREPKQKNAHRVDLGVERAQGKLKKAH